MNIDTTNWRNDKILTLEQAAEQAHVLREGGNKIVTVNGSFDIMHAGHLDQLEEAKKQGDVLFVGLNSDLSIKREKGVERPFIPEQARAALLAALICVDFVVIINAPYRDVPNLLLEAVKPQVHVNGPDYGMPETWLEWPMMQKLGIRGYSVVRRNNFSTSDLVKKIRQ